MSLPRLRLENCSCEGGRCVLNSERAHHVVRVPRCYTGSFAEGLLRGEKVELKLICEGENVYAEEISRKREEPAAVELHLLLGLLKNDQFDDALRFSAETGVHTIHLLDCERSVPKYEGKKLDEKMNRWSKILDEATKQAGSALPPKLSYPLPLKDFDFDALPCERYAALLSSGTRDLRDITVGSSAAVAIGPEGDWAPHESALLLEKGFTAVSHGMRILRASTAVAVSCGWFSLQAPKE